MSPVINAKVMKRCTFRKSSSDEIVEKLNLLLTLNNGTGDRDKETHVEIGMKNTN